jgi:hypothetical protein
MTQALERKREYMATYRRKHPERIAASRAAYYESHKVETKLNRLERKAWRREQVQRIKLESGCVDCGYRDNPFALDFDHVEGSKVACVGTLVHDLVAWDRILAEISKCVVRCANCHRIRTFQEAS